MPTVLWNRNMAQTTSRSATTRTGSYWKMKKIKVTAEIYIFCNRNIPSDELAFKAEMALNSMSSLEIGEGPIFAYIDKAAYRFHFKNERPEVIIGEDPKDD